MRSTRRLIGALVVSGLSTLGLAIGSVITAPPATAEADASLPTWGSLQHIATRENRDGSGRVIAPNGLYVREGPGTDYDILGSLRGGEVVPIRCKVIGEQIGGNSRWYKIYGGYVSARYVENLATIRWCNR